MMDRLEIMQQFLEERIAEREREGGCRGLGCRVAFVCFIIHIYIYIYIYLFIYLFPTLGVGLLDFKLNSSPRPVYSSLIHGVKSLPGVPNLSGVPECPRSAQLRVSLECPNRESPWSAQPQSPTPEYLYQERVGMFAENNLFICLFYLLYIYIYIRYPPPPPPKDLGIFMVLGSVLGFKGWGWGAS